MADPAALPAWREGITDEQIAQQMNAISADVASAQPLVSHKEDLSVLFGEYEDNPAFLPKLSHMVESGKYAAIRRARGDGNCFYRSLMVSLGEAFVAAGVVTPGPGKPSPASASPLQGQYERLLGLVAGSLDRLVNAGYPKDTTQDFVEVFQDWLKGLGQPGASVEVAALGPLRADTSFYALYFTRLLTALELKSNPDAYLPYIMGTSECETVDEFCNVAVEPSSVDADMVQMMALCAALGIAARITYLDATPGDAPQEVAIPEAVAPGTMVVDLLYRPGHYDVVYRA